MPREIHKKPESKKPRLKPFKCQLCSNIQLIYRALDKVEMKHCNKCYKVKFIPPNQRRLDSDGCHLQIKCGNCEKWRRTKHFQNLLDDIGEGEADITCDKCRAIRQEEESAMTLRQSEQQRRDDAQSMMAQMQSKSSLETSIDKEQMAIPEQMQSKSSNAIIAQVDSIIFAIDVETTGFNGNDQEII